MWGRGEPASAGSGTSFAEQLNLKLKHSPWLGFFAFIGSLTLIAFLIIWLRPVIMPLVMAIFLSYIVRPLAESVSNFESVRAANLSASPTLTARPQMAVAAARSLSMPRQAVCWLEVC